MALDIPRLNLGLVVALDDLRGKVLEAHRRGERGADSVEIGCERARSVGCLVAVSAS